MEQAGQAVVAEADQIGSVERLRQIIARRERREVGYDEAREVGSSLIEFYQLLAEGADDEPED